MHPKELSISDFNYALPEEKIAIYPLEKRDQSKLLIYTEGNITEDIYRNIADHLPEKMIFVCYRTEALESGT